MSEGAREGDERDPGGASPGRVGSRQVYSGRIVHLSVDRVRFPDGTEGELEFIEHPGASAVVPFLDPPGDDDPRVLLIRQYRYAAGGWLWEIPAGMPDSPRESPEECARRELEEETGWSAGELHRMTAIFTTPGFTDERIHLFAATGLVRGRVNRDLDEFLSVEAVRFSRVREMIRDGEIADGKSLCALLWADRFLAGF